MKVNILCLRFDRYFKQDACFESGRKNQYFGYFITPIY